jgi:hypothetical protein
MTDVVWSRYGGEDCLRVRRVAPHATVRVRAGATEVVGELPAMAGQLARDGDDLCFVPRFAFVDGTAYTVVVDGATIETLVRPGDGDGVPTTEVIAIHPTATTVPRNLLRCYVTFSARMSEGEAARHIALVDEEGRPIDGALLPSEHELWDSERRRLTVLLDPARIKRGLVAHRTLGYPLRTGESFALEVGAGFRDAAGRPLRAGASQRYRVGDDERRRVDPDQWTLHAPRHGTRDPLAVVFDRPLDRALLARCLHVLGRDGQSIEGSAHIGAEERVWTFAPSRPWASATHQLAVDPVLEDVAGNSVTRVFDRDLTMRHDRVVDTPTYRSFEPR